MGCWEQLTYGHVLEGQPGVPCRAGPGLQEASGTCDAGGMLSGNSGKARVATGWAESFEGSSAECWKGEEVELNPYGKDP